MEWFIGIIVVGVAFVAGWCVGLVVETIETHRERRLVEAQNAELNKQFYLEQRSDR
jgi:hypothetical protein